MSFLLLIQSQSIIIFPQVLHHGVKVDLRTFFQSEILEKFLHIRFSIVKMDEPFKWVVSDQIPGRPNAAAIIHILEIQTESFIQKANFINNSAGNEKKGAQYPIRIDHLIQRTVPVQMLQVDPAALEEFSV